MGEAKMTSEKWQFSGFSRFFQFGVFLRESQDQRSNDHNSTERLNPLLQINRAETQTVKKKCKK
jgi:hypothetical protein